MTAVIALTAAEAEAIARADEAQHAIHARFDVLQRRAHRTLAPAIRAWQRADAARKAGVAA